MAFSSMVTRSTLVPLGTSSCSVLSRSLILSLRFCSKNVGSDHRSTEESWSAVLEVAGANSNF